MGAADMRTRTNIVAALTLTVLGIGLAAARPAHAQTRGYVVSLWVPAMNSTPEDGDCPNGKNPNAPGMLERILKEEGRPQAEIDRILKPETFGGGVYGQHAAMRGRIDGKPVNVYANPVSVSDPNIKLAVTKDVFGFNLDGKEKPGDPVDPQTGEKGVDNQMARIFGCFDRERGTLDGPPTNKSVRWGYYNYGNSWLIEIKNRGTGSIDFQNEDHVEVTIYRGLQPPMKNSSGYQRDMTYAVDPDPRLQSNTFTGKIRNGLFVSDVPMHIRMIASTEILPVYDFKEAHLRLNFKPDGTLEGFLGGYMPITLLYSPLGNYGSGMEFNGGVDVPGVFHAMRRLADTDIDRDPETGARTRISQTYLIRAVPAFLTRQPLPTGPVVR
jgi:hypothetical protein